MKTRSGAGARRQMRSRLMAAGRLRKRQQTRGKSKPRRKPAGKTRQMMLDLHPFRRAGRLAGKQFQADVDLPDKHASQAWQAYAAELPELDSVGAALQAGSAFMQGYAQTSGRASDIVPLPLRHAAAAVVCACNEERTLGQVLRQLRRLPLRDIVVVLNGTTDNSLGHVLQHPGITLVYEPDRAGHDVGRALGVKMTDAETVLFVDGDMVVPAEQLAPFLFTIDRGQDVALNDLTSLLPPFAKQDEVSRIKAYLNHTLGRRDLGSNSMTAVPHAVSRRMIQAVKPASLAVPPMAQMLAVQQGLQVSAPYQVDVIRSNRLRPGNTGRGNDVARLILGDHLEALAAWLERNTNAVQANTPSRTEVAYRRNAR
ncbi:glycosyltransferase family A protein [Paenibacillus sp. FSL R7-0652]|uniref:Glycosyltransferase family A protein n=1 Tax=Paenibacillus sp. AN1007 TaxID=3151385 RepID=A0AAU8NFR6_9BACL